MTAGSLHHRFALAALSAMLLILGCTDGEFTLFKQKEKPPPPEKPPETVAARDPLLADTIGELALLADSEPLRVRGFGVVVGLGDSGGSDVPESIREYLIDYLTKEMTSHSDSARPFASPERLLASPDCAVVEVQGFIPPGAPPGTLFDVQVEAVGTQARSIDGGLLLPCELKIYESAASGQGLIGGKALARARGPVFTNPFTPGSDEVTKNLRRGSILGGGKSLEPRTVRVMLTQPSYSQARRMEGRLNERFGTQPKVAEAMSQGYVILKTPLQYADDPEHFLDLSMRVMLQNSPAAMERRLREISSRLEESRDKLKDISLIWEGVGKTALPSIQPLYAHADPEVRFYAARAGIRLRDSTAVNVIGQIAADTSSPFGLAAVRELSMCDMPAAVGRLYALLDADTDVRRISAYEGLLKRRHPSITTFRFPCALDRTICGVVLDVVESRGKPLIYVRRAAEPRIAIFGGRVAVQTPMFYNHPQDLVTINADDGATELTVFCRTRASGKLTSSITVPARLMDLIRALAALPVADESGRFPGMGLTYTPIIEVLDTLTRDKTIAAQFVLEKPKLSDLLGPSPADRPEAETPKSDDDEQSAGSQPSDGSRKPSGTPLLPKSSKDRPE